MDSQPQSVRLKGLFFGVHADGCRAILHELTHAAGLPVEALQAASVQRAEMLPKFLGVIETTFNRCGL